MTISELITLQAFAQANNLMNKPFIEVYDMFVSTIVKPILNNIK